MNLSSEGILFEAAERFAVGTRIQLSIARPIKLDVKLALKLWATGAVIRNHGHHVAVHLSKHEFRIAGIAGV